MNQQEALDRAREMMGNNSAMFIMGTVDADNRPRMRWMGAIVRDPEDENAYYMASMSGARKVTQLTANQATQLLFNSEDFSCVVTADGRSEMVEDMTIKRIVWDAIPASGEYFESPESEAFGVIKFVADSIEVLCMAEGHEPVCIDLRGCC